MPQDLSNKKLQNANFVNQDLQSARFSGSDLRGADFTGSNLANADFVKVKTGIPPLQATLIFLAALVVSLLSGYVAMLTGHTVQSMLNSPDQNVRISGYVAIVLTISFIVFAYLKGGGPAIRNLVIPACIIAILMGLTGYFTGLGTGRGMGLLVLSVLLVLLMFIVGTISRAAAGSLSSNILFIVVALGGGMFGKSLGGGIGTVIMAISCALISKKALSGAKGFESLRKIAFVITSRFGTSFRNARLTNASFSGTKIQNSDFTGADLSLVNWEDAKKINCLIIETEN